MTVYNYFSITHSLLYQTIIFLILDTWQKKGAGREEQSFQWEIHFKEIEKNKYRLTTFSVRRNPQIGIELCKGRTTQVNSSFRSLTKQSSKERELTKYSSHNKNLHFFKKKKKVLSVTGLFPQWFENESRKHIYTSTTTILLQKFSNS